MVSEKYDLMPSAWYTILAANKKYPRGRIVKGNKKEFKPIGKKKNL